MCVLKTEVSRHSTELLLFGFVYCIPGVHRSAYTCVVGSEAEACRGQPIAVVILEPESAGTGQVPGGPGIWFCWDTPGS